MPIPIERQYEVKSVPIIKHPFTRVTQNDAAFAKCTWCYGKGCLACANERERHNQAALEPLFIAQKDNKHDMELLKQFFSKDAIEKAFLEGEGMQT